jgi:surfeit locus 1 family protein
MSLAISPLRFAPPWWAWLLAGAGLAGALALGGWQLQRAENKRALLADYLAAQTAAPVPLNAQTPAGAQPLAVSVTGTYEVQRQLLLDNQALRERPGYHVWTPLRLADGGLVLVNRGWVAQFADRAVPPALAAPAGLVELRGLWRALPRRPARRCSVFRISWSIRSARSWPACWASRWPTVCCCSIHGPKAALRASGALPS